MGKIYLGTQGGVPFVYNDFVGIEREVSEQGVYKLVSSNYSWRVPDDATSVGERCLQYAFQYCTGLTSADFNNVTTIERFGIQYAFQYCTNLTTVSLSKVSSIAAGSCFQYAFRGCTSLTTISFPALTTSSFGNIVNQFSNMISGCTGVTLHFPSTVQSQVSSLNGYPNFGGTNTTVLFDL